MTLAGAVVKERIYLCSVCTDLNDKTHLSGALPVLPVAVLLLLSFPLIDWTAMV